MKFVTTVAASLLVLASLTIAADQERNLAKNYRAAERMLGQERINANLRERVANLAKAYQAGHGERLIMNAYQAAERMVAEERQRKVKRS